jgi:lactate 2-monooxygenase
MSPVTNYGDHQMGIYLQGFAGRKPPFPLMLADLEAEAKAKLDPRAYWYVAGGAGSEATVGTNRRAFDKWQIVPRMLTNVAERDHTTTVLGQTFASPIMVAPVGVQEIIHPEAEVAVARGSASVKVPMILSTLSSYKLEDVAAAHGDTPHWFQLYWPKDDDLMRSFVGRAEAAGYRAIVVTLDTKIIGWRERDLQETYLPFLEGKGLANFTSDPVFRAMLAKPPEEDMRAAATQWGRVFTDPSQTWDDLKKIRDATKLPLVLKGVLHPDDARKAVELGIDGLIVSNHGGRQVDGSIGALDALPGVIEAVGDRCEVLFDSGIRHGADVVKALGLGARAVCVGRPWVYGLAVGGSDGVAEVLRRLLADYDLTMALSGLRNVREITRDLLVPA